MSNDEDPTERRSLIASVSTLFMAGGLAAAYGTLAAFMARYLYPAKDTATSWLYVTTVSSLGTGESLIFRIPNGASVAVARSGGGGASDFVALSSVCPHLGCQVHWEPHNDRFFCPCHNGVFDPSGKALSGPPAEGGQDLDRYPLKIENGLLFIEVPVEQLAGGGGRGTIERPCGPPGPGHDPCLYAGACDRRRA